MLAGDFTVEHSRFGRFYQIKIVRGRRPAHRTPKAELMDQDEILLDAEDRMEKALKKVKTEKKIHE